MPPVFPFGTMPPMPLIHPAFGTGPMFYMPPVTLICRLDDMLSTPLEQHILDFEPPREFFILDFTTFDGSADLYNHMLHYNQVMKLNAGNDQLLCKVFLASFVGACVVLVPQAPRNLINSFNELWATFVSQYFCFMRQKRNISSL